MNKQHHHTTGNETVYEWQGPPHLQLVRRNARLADGRPFLSHALIANRGKTGVVIIASSGDRIILVQQFRPAANRQMLELPRGFGETECPDDTAGAHAAWCQDAEREFREETGYEAMTSRVIGTYITDSALLPSRVAVVAITVSADLQPHERDGEVEDVIWVARSSFNTMIRTGQIEDAHTLSAWAMFSTG